MKNGIYFVLSALLAFTLIWCGGRSGGDPDFGDAPFTTLTISDAAAFAAAKTAIETAGGGNYALNITGTIEVAGADTIIPAANTVVSLRGGGTIHKTSAGAYLFAIRETDSKLILRDAVLKGHSNNDSSLVYVGGGAAFDMIGGTISGNSASLGGGVRVGIGWFTMSGGTISSNTAAGGSGKGGGVFVFGGIFTMIGGTINGNSANGGGGVYVDAADGGTFTKTGGTIGGNTATAGDTNGHAVYVYIPDYIDNYTGNRYRDTTAGSGDNISVPTDISKNQGAAPWL